MFKLRKLPHRIINPPDLSLVVKSFRRYKLLYLLLSFAVVWTIIFQYLPMLGLVMAFQDFDILKGVFNSPFVGFKHFISIVEIPAMRKAVGNTLLYSGVKLIFGFPLPILFALLLNEIRMMKFKRIVQTISYLPHFLSWIAIVSLFYSFFELNGSFNDARVFLFGEGTERLNILLETKYFLGIIFFSSVYKGIGWGTIIYLAAISSISPQLYEAAVIDGCGRLKQAIHITVPSILPTIMILFILRAGRILEVGFEQIIGFQNLYTQMDTEVISTVVYKYGLRQGNFSLATAFGLGSGLISFLILITVNRISKRLSNIGVW